MRFFERSTHRRVLGHHNIYAYLTHAAARLIWHSINCGGRRSIQLNVSGCNILERRVDPARTTNGEDIFLGLFDAGVATDDATGNSRLEGDDVSWI